MTHIRFSNFHCVYTIIQLVHTAFKSSTQMIHKKTAAAVITELISEKNRKREFLFAELQLKDEYNPFYTHFIIATFYYYQILFVEFTPWKRQK